MVGVPSQSSVGFSPSSPRMCFDSVHRCFKHRLGGSSRQSPATGCLDPSGAVSPYKRFRAESGLFGSKRFSRKTAPQTGPHLLRQFHCGFLSEQRRGHQVHTNGSLGMAHNVLVLPKSHSSQGKTHSWQAESGSRFSVQKGSSGSNRVVSPSKNFQSHLPAVAHSSHRSVCHPIQRQTASVCLPHPRPEGLGGRCPQFAMAQPRRLHLLPHTSVASGLAKVTDLPLQDGGHSPRVARHALVLGSCRPLHPDSSEAV